MGPCGLYYKTLWAHNARQMDRFRSKLVSFILLVTRRIPITNTLAYYEICTLQHGPCGLGQYYKILRTHNEQETDRFCFKIVSFIW
jgi:hypothetical protein